MSHRSSRRRRVAGAFALILLAAGLGLLFWPQLLGLQRQAIIAQVLALRGVALAAGAAAAVLLLLLVLLSRRARRAAVPVLVVVLLFTGAETAVLAGRGLGDPSPTATRTDGSTGLTVLSWNTGGDQPGAERIAALALAQGADVVALPETSEATAARVAVLMRAGGRPMWVHNRYFDAVLKARTTSLLLSVDLGRYALDLGAGSTRRIPSGVFRPVDGSGPVFVAAHPVAPVPGEMSAWRDGVRWVADQCTGSNVIVAGDLNSTLDHWDGLGRGGGQLGTCRDGAGARGAAAEGTWPADLPAQVGAPIDHVLATPDWVFTGFRVIGTADGAGSDHRPIVATLRRSG
ncbi:MAG: endonuclease/exonuclease/phosphatase family protein [Micrococcales bacterium]|nr:endonuclease/exonuclease/phosphatase family protein [Micrococcales bacterium]